MKDSSINLILRFCSYLHTKMLPCLQQLNLGSRYLFISLIPFSSKFCEGINTYTLAMWLTLCHFLLITQAKRVPRTPFFVFSSYDLVCFGVSTLCSLLVLFWNLPMKVSCEKQKFVEEFGFTATRVVEATIFLNRYFPEKTGKEIIWISEIEINCLS